MDRQPYPSDLTDEEWQVISYQLSHPPHKGPGGRPKKYHDREIINAIMYLTKSGCQWRMLPHDLPPWKSVYGYFSTLRKIGLCDEMNDYLL